MGFRNAMAFTGEASPLMTTSPQERAELSDKLSAPVIKAFEAGIITKEQAAEELKERGGDLGLWQSL